MVKRMLYALAHISPFLIGYGMCFVAYGVYYRNPTEIYSGTCTTIMGLAGNLWLKFHKEA